jgi:hypothetical protein
VRKHGRVVPRHCLKGLTPGLRHARLPKNSQVPKASSGSATKMAISRDYVERPHSHDPARAPLNRTATPPAPRRLSRVDRRFAISDPLVYAPDVSPSADPPYNRSARESPVIKSLLRAVAFVRSLAGPVDVALALRRSPTESAVVRDTKGHRRSLQAAVNTETLAFVA